MRAKSTSDLGWAAALSGNQTADLIGAVIGGGSNRDFLRRELPPIIDLLAEFGRARESLPSCVYGFGAVEMCRKGL